LPKGSRSVTALAFNRDSTLIACADFHNDHHMYVFEWLSKTQRFCVNTGGNKIFSIEWSPVSDTFCSVGPKHIFFWDVKGAKK
jgi:hypothetical protein